jgi:hypothetical protein
MWDACDPDSFNAAFGAGTYLPGNHGKMLLDDFAAELQTDHIAGAWRFNPLLDASAGTFELAGLELEPGEHISIVNKDGE